MSFQPRRLIVCLDGTWNDGINTKEPATNVARISRCVMRESVSREYTYQQIVYYRAGVGTGTSTFSNINDAIWGKGIDFTIRDAYFSLCQNYTSSNDEIVLIGFSRGAFAVRVLAHFIQEFGILRNASLTTVFARFEIWKNQNVKTGTPAYNRWLNLDREYGYLNDEQVYRSVKIRACAAWDTVAALPGDEFSFVDEQIPTNVELAVQALALNEERSKFRPLLWKRPDDAPGDQKLEQCWFLGAHGDVGGVEKDLSLSNITFAWMIEQLSGVIGFDMSVAGLLGTKPFNDDDELTGDAVYSFFEDTMLTTEAPVVQMKMELPFRDFKRRTDVHVGISELSLRLTGWNLRQPFSGGETASERLHWSVDILTKKAFVSSCNSLRGKDMASLAIKPKGGFEDLLLSAWLFSDCERIIWKGITSHKQTQHDSNSSTSCVSTPSASSIPSAPTTPTTPSTTETPHKLLSQSTLVKNVPISPNDVLPTHAVLTSPESWSISEAGHAKDTHVTFEVDGIGSLQLDHRHLCGPGESWQTNLSSSTRVFPVQASGTSPWDFVGGPSKMWKQAWRWYAGTTPMLVGSVEIDPRQMDARRARIAGQNNFNGSGFVRVHKRAYLNRTEWPHSTS